MHPQGGQYRDPNGELQDKQKVQAASLSESPGRDRQQGDPQMQAKPSQAELLEREHVDEPRRLRILPRRPSKTSVPTFIRPLTPSVR